MPYFLPNFLHTTGNAGFCHINSFKKESDMYKKILLAAIAAFMLIASQITVAQAADPWPGHHPPGSRPAGPPPPPPRAQAPHVPPQQHHPSAYGRPLAPQGYNNRYRSSNSWRNSHGYFRPGYALPSYYHRGYKRYILNDWRGYGLYAPPPGHQWLLVDGNFVLAAIGTGIISQILLAP